VAIEQALTVLGWYENADPDEVPPERLWEDPVGLEEWWKWVKEKHADGREDVAPSNRSGRSSEDDDDEHPDPGMAENDIARYLKD